MMKWLRIASKVGFCECSNDHSDSIKGGMFLNYLSGYYLLKMNLLHGVSYTTISWYLELDNDISSTLDRMIRAVSPWLILLILVCKFREKYVRVG